MKQSWDRVTRKIILLCDNDAEFKKMMAILEEIATTTWEVIDNDEKEFREEK